MNRNKQQMMHGSGSREQESGRGSSPVSRPSSPVRGLWRLRLCRSRRRRIANYWGHTDRKGSVLLVVIGLLLLLMLVGFTFFTFASQENTSAEYYSDAAKEFTVALDADVLMDFALEQLIIGPHETYKQSVLWPGRHSLVPNALGMFTVNAQGYPIPTDRHPFDGEGVNVIGNASGAPVVDADHDGGGDHPDHLRLNFSPAATILLYGGTGLARADILNVNNFPTIDAGYTYPDINNVFLAHSSTVNGVPVYIPSFHRPQYLRQPNGSEIPNWQTNANTAGAVMRPHPSHVNVDDGVTPRYILGPAPETVGAGPRTVAPFIFTTDTNSNGLFGEQGVWTNRLNPNNIEFDTDNDNDGVREGVWLDLNFPMQNLPDGRNYVPLFSYTVMEADGLLNVNLHGNIAGLIDLSHPVGAGQSASRSNMGLSAAEVSPFWALSADPQNAAYVNPPLSIGNPTSNLQQHRGFFGLSNLNPAQYGIDRMEAANMELAMLMLGRGKYSVTILGSGAEQFTLNDLQEGRWGERQLLSTGANQPNPKSLGPFPRPGRAGIDDDADQLAGVVENDPILSLQPLYVFPAYGRTIQPNGHPLDNSGSGYQVQTFNYGAGNERGVTLLPDPGNPLVPTRFVQYNGYMGGSQYQGLMGGYFSANPNVNGMLDEGDEVVVDRRYQAQFGTFDQIFGPDELAGLHMSAADYSTILGSSRLRQLMPFNFESNLQARAIRQRFTTDSWDRREHGFSYCNYPVGNERGLWEFNVDLDNDTRYEFPPAVLALSGAPFNVNAPFQRLNVAEPFRNELRAVIGAELANNNLSVTLHNKQLRLKLNRLLTRGDPSMPVSTSNPPIYRQLTPHPDLLSATHNNPIPGSPGGPAPPATFNPGAGPTFQEYWARVDRQVMARDIYVLLYMLGGGNDALNYTSSNADPDGAGPLLRPLYQDWQLKEMAHFAVNFVDALDRDDVITRFEYDRNLADGWNLDDYPYSTSDAIPPADRGEVFGVEAQSLTLSEALCLKQPQATAGDNPLTAYNDLTGGDRYFTHIELRNAGVKPVLLQNGLADGQWRVRMHRPGTVTAPDYSVVLKYNGLTPGSPYTIQPNAQYTIGSVTRSIGDGDNFDPGTGVPVYRGADFRVDFDNDNRFNRVVPNVVDPGPLATVDVPPGTNLDLIHLRDFGANRFSLIEHNGPYPLSQGSPQTGIDRSGLRGAFGGFMLNPGNAGEAMLFILERRVHLNRTAALATDAQQNEDNPWVVVDVLQDPFGQSLPLMQNFPLQNSDTAATVQSYLQLLTSVERPRPLDRTGTAQHAPSIPYANTIGAISNSNVPASQHVVWQPHFDRDFASVIELLSIPLYGPSETTGRLAYQGKLLTDLTYPAAPSPSSNGYLYQVNTAAGKFTQPYNRFTDPITGANVHNNRWYRILELLEFPNRSHKQIEDAYQTELLRVPGKVNLNMIRHGEVLMGLVDDPSQFSQAWNGGLNANVHTDTLEPGRDWYQQFLVARDGRDPYTGLVLPGAPVSRPFRDFSQANAPLNAALASNTIPGIERTLLRRLPYDSEDVNDNGTAGGPVDPGEDANNNGILDINGNYARRLLEARTANDLPPANNYVDPHTRNRLLAKVANNTTNRSNVFVVWITVGFFDSYAPNPANPNVVKIGAEMTDQPRYRGFFVVDRTQLENAYDSQSGTFDFRKFIQYRKTIE